MTFISSSTNDRFIPVGLPSDPTNLELFGKFAKKYKENYDLGYEIASKTYSNIFNLDLIPEAGINELKKLETQFKNTVGNGNNVDWANPDNLKKAMDLLGSASSNPVIKNSLALTNQARVDLGSYKDDMDAGTASVINYSNFIEGQNGYNSLKTAKAEDLGGGKVKLRRYNPTFDLTKAKTDCLSKAKQDIQAIDSPNGGYIVNETTKQITAEKNRALLIGCLGESATARTQYRENAEYYHRNSTPEQRASWKELTTSNLEESVKRSNTRRAELELEYKAGLHKIETDDKINVADKDKYKGILKSNYDTGLVEINNSIQKTNVSIGRMGAFDINSASISEDYLSDMSEALLSSDLYAMAVGASQNQYSRSLKPDAVVSSHLDRMWEIKKEEGRMKLATQEAIWKNENNKRKNDISEGKSSEIGDGDMVTIPASGYSGAGSNAEGQIGFDVEFKSADDKYKSSMDLLKIKVGQIMQNEDPTFIEKVANDVLDGKLDDKWTEAEAAFIKDKLFVDPQVKGAIDEALIQKNRKVFLYNKMKTTAEKTGVITALQTHFRSVENDYTSLESGTNNKAVVEFINKDKNSESAKFFRKKLNISNNVDITEADLENFFNSSSGNKFLGNRVGADYWVPNRELRNLLLKDGLIGESEGGWLVASSIEDIFRVAGTGNSNYTLNTEDAKRLSSPFVKTGNKGYYKFKGKRPSELTLDDWIELSQNAKVSFPRIVENITKRSGKSSSVSTSGEAFLNGISTNVTTRNSVTVSDTGKNKKLAEQILIEGGKYDLMNPDKGNPYLKSMTTEGMATVTFTDKGGKERSEIIKVSNPDIIANVTKTAGTDTELDTNLKTSDGYSHTIYISGKPLKIQNNKGVLAVYYNNKHSPTYSAAAQSLNISDFISSLKNELETRGANQKK
jgi:hypothetical protein